MKRKIIKKANIVNDGKITVADVLIVGERIEIIANSISYNNADVIDAEGLYLLPGVIDDQVHFREPGLTHKGSLFRNKGSRGWWNYFFYGNAKHHSKYPNATVVRRKIYQSICHLIGQLFLFYGNKSRQYRRSFKNG